MILAALGRHWPARKMEWIMAGISASWGFYVLTHPELFTNPETAVLMSGLASFVPAGWDPSLVWGLGALLVGLMRGIALYINGAHIRTPVVRAVAAFLTILVFFQVSRGLWATGVPNMGLVIYPWLVIADIISAYSAGQDAIQSEVQRQIERGTFRGTSIVSREPRPSSGSSELRRLDLGGECIGGRGLEGLADDQAEPQRAH